MDPRPRASAVGGTPYPALGQAPCVTTDRGEHEVLVRVRDENVVDRGAEQRSRYDRAAGGRLRPFEVEPVRPAVVGTPHAGVSAEIGSVAASRERTAPRLARHRLQLAGEPYRRVVGTRADVVDAHALAPRSS